MTPLVHYHDMESRDCLARAPLFEGIEPALLDRLARASRRVSLERGGVLFLEGDPGSELYVVAEGAVRLYKLSGAGQETTVRIVEPPEIFGEAVFFQEGTYPVSAVAVRYSALYAISRSTFRTLLADEPFRDEFIASLVMKLRYLSGRLHDLTAYDVEERFFRFVRAQCGGALRCSIDLPKKEIAAAIGTTPETLSRLILRLRERGDIEWKGKDLRLREGLWKDLGADD
ncbi:MAG: Crp/Fnr family transcriptional regulator [Candidatus Krumholzibacteria bacterium]|nr:Crp/Fnr family transcriptional regulator [Candidatus Krumholzibacteria bacterium]